MNVGGSNQLRIPFAEWLYRMMEDKLPYQARALAVYAAVFKIHSNDELGSLVGMASDKGVADRTYDKWKKHLLEHGWVIIRRRSGGRGLGIEVEPSYKETPVTFTDVSPRSARKFYPRIDETTGAENTGVTTETGAIITGVTKKGLPHTPSKENTPNPSSVAENTPRELAAALTYDEFSEKLLSACNGTLANPAAAPGLLNLLTPTMWIEHGADLERDIVPTLRAVSSKKRGGRISTWDYFTPAVTEAVAKRKAGLPQFETQQVTSESERDRQDRIRMGAEKFAAYKAALAKAGAANA